MKCLRCGYCCKYFCVVIVNDPQNGIRKDNLIFHDGDGTPCKHLIGDRPGNYSCAIHNYPWYKDTPCFQHGQMEVNEFDKCRMGEYVLKNSRIKR